MFFHRPCEAVPRVVIRQHVHPHRLRYPGASVVHRSYVRSIPVAVHQRIPGISCSIKRHRNKRAPLPPSQLGLRSLGNKISATPLLALAIYRTRWLVVVAAASTVTTTTTAATTAVKAAAIVANAIVAGNGGGAAAAAAAATGSDHGYLHIIGRHCSLEGGWSRKKEEGGGGQRGRGVLSLCMAVVV